MTNREWTNADDDCLKLHHTCESAVLVTVAVEAWQVVLQCGVVLSRV